MAKLDKDSMSAWFGLLPPDVASCMEISELSQGESEARSIAMALPGFKNGGELLGYVSEFPDSFKSIGRARRLRLLAWLVAGKYPDKAKAMQALAETDEGSEGSGGGVGKIAPYFKADIRALVEAVAPRAARRIVDGATLAAVTGAAYEVAGELEMRSGGGL